MIKLIAPVYRKPGLSDEEFYKYWKEKHGPLVTNIVPGLRRYVQNHPIKIPGHKYEADGFAESWWDDLDAYKSWLAWRQSDEAKPLVDDEEKFMDRSRISRYIVEEHVIIN